MPALQFVPNLTFGPELIKACRKYTSTPFETQLMVSNYNCDSMLEEYVAASKGPNGEPGVVIAHVEANVRSPRDSHRPPTQGQLSSRALPHSLAAALSSSASHHASRLRHSHPTSLRHSHPASLRHAHPIPPASRDRVHLASNALHPTPSRRRLPPSLPPSPSSLRHSLTHSLTHPPLTHPPDHSPTFLLP